MIEIIMMKRNRIVVSVEEMLIEFGFLDLKVVW